MIGLQVLLILGILALMALRTLNARGATEGQLKIDIGLVFVFVAGLYSAIPLLGYFLAYGGFGWIQDSRLAGGLPVESNIQYIGWLYIALIVGFFVAYIGTVATVQASSNSERSRQTFEKPSLRDVLVCCLIYACLRLSIVGLRSFYNIEQGVDYLDSYAVVAEQSLIVQQLIGALTSLSLAAAFLAMLSIIAWRPRAHGLVALFVLLLVVESVLVAGQRRDAFLCALAYFVIRSIYGPRISSGSAVAYAVGGVTVFLLAGMHRQESIALESSPEWAFLQGGEFLMLFNNAVDLLEKGETLRSKIELVFFYFSDLFRLIPRQFIGEKIDLSRFYVEILYPEFSAAGGGFAFGAVAESVIGEGVFEALLRGAALGVILGFLRRAIDRRHISLRTGLVYVWFTAMCYEGIRDTTFTLLPRFVLQVLPLLLILSVVGLSSTRAKLLVRRT